MVSPRKQSGDNVLFVTEEEPVRHVREQERLVAVLARSAKETDDAGPAGDKAATR